jgi:monoamine oxidase
LLKRFHLQFSGEESAMLETAIVGGGLCGLAVANSLLLQGREYTLFEARERLGGRIVTAHSETTGLPVDLGPSWYWPDLHPRVAGLVASLGLESFAQWDSGTVLRRADPNAKPEASTDPVHGGARRLIGGMASLVQALADRLPAATVHTAHELVSVRDAGAHVELQFRTAGGVVAVLTRHVVLALPPRLLDQRVSFEPALDGPIRRAMQGTPTWMAGQAKAVMAYDKPFWRADGYSGTAYASFSQATLGEAYDASDAEGERGALGGFVALSPELRRQYRAGLRILVASQLAGLFGAAAEEGEFIYQDWADEPLTCSTLDQAPLEAEPRYGSLPLRLSHWDDKLYFGGTETAAYGGGYMEGALEAAGRIRRDLSLGWGLAA